MFLIRVCRNLGKRFVLHTENDKSAENQRLFILKSDSFLCINLLNCPKNIHEQDIPVVFVFHSVVMR